MTDASNHWNTIHPSAFGHAAGLLRWVEATPRPRGALRYRCPLSESFVCVTDDETLAALDRPRARVRCFSCGEFHLVTQAGDGAETAIVDATALP